MHAAHALCAVQGFLKTAMMNYLALLGWNDGTEQEIYSPEELQGAFTIDRITKSPAVFDKVKLSWMNGQHLRALPAADVQALVGPALVEAGLLSRADSPFAAAAVALMQQSLELVSDGETELRRYLRYPLAESLSTDAAAKFVEDNFRDLAAHVVEQYDSGDLPTVRCSLRVVGRVCCADSLRGGNTGIRRCPRRELLPACVMPPLGVSAYGSGRREDRIGAATPCTSMGRARPVHAKGKHAQVMGRAGAVWPRRRLAGDLRMLAGRSG